MQFPLIVFIDALITVPEMQGTIKDIAMAKSKEAFKAVGRPVLVDDTSLIFDAFGGELPGSSFLSPLGPYIKWFLLANGHEGTIYMSGFI